jgi:hypothetical protein
LIEPPKEVANTEDARNEDYQIRKQRHEEMSHEVEFNRRAKALRAIGKRRAGRIAALVWEIKRHAGRLFKLLRTLRIAG